MIAIKTRLHKGIYRNEGGGQTVTHYQWKHTGPRNVLRAVHILAAHREKMHRCYGNIGCGISWLEIDGNIVDDELIQMELRYWKTNPQRHVYTRLQLCRELIRSAA